MIEIKNLSKKYGDLTAVNNVSLTIQKGELFGLLGPNGAGKTTLINILAGLLPEDKGSVLISGLGIKTHAREIRKKLGFVPQDLAFYRNYSARDNIGFFASLYGLKGRALREAVSRALEFTGLKESGKKPAKSFSGGMKRRLNIACGIAHNPEIIFLDEPTAGIDPQSRNHILCSVEELQHKGCTIIYTTHYMEEAENICSRIGILDQGKLIASGSQEELKQLVRDSSRIVFQLKSDAQIDLGPFKKIPGVIQADYSDLTLQVTSEVGINNINLITAEVNRQEVTVTDIRTDSPSLETVFLNLTGRSLRD